MDEEHDMHPASEDEEDHVEDEDKSEEEGDEVNNSLEQNQQEQGYYEQQEYYGSSEGVSAEVFQQEIQNMVENSLYAHNDKVHTAFDRVGELLNEMNELAEDEAEAARSCVAKAQHILDEREAAARRTAERHQKMLKRIGGQRR